MLLILDASVVAKWFKEEEGSDRALKIREEFYNGLHEIIVPDLILYEISNALRFDKKFDFETISKATASLFDMDLTITIPSEELILNSTKLALDLGITIYDAVYVELASQTSGVFITADEALHEKIKKIRNCKLLSDFSFIDK